MTKLFSSRSVKSIWWMQVPNGKRLKANGFRVEPRGAMGEVSQLSQWAPHDGQSSVECHLSDPPVSWWEKQPVVRLFLQVGTAPFQNRYANRLWKCCCFVVLWLIDLCKTKHIVLAGCFTEHAWAGHAVDRCLMQQMHSSDHSCQIAKKVEWDL